MFELRWLEDDGVRLLQYRRVENVIQDVQPARTWLGRPALKETAVWGEWTDVPVHTPGSVR